MKTTEEIFRSLTNCTDSLFTFEKSMYLADKVAKKYAIQVAQDVRSRCAENAELISGGDDSVWGDCIDKQSILYTDIILP